MTILKATYRIPVFPLCDDEGSPLLSDECNYNTWSHVLRSAQRGASAGPSQHLLHLLRGTAFGEYSIESAAVAVNLTSQLAMLSNVTDQFTPAVKTRGCTISSENYDIKGASCIGWFEINAGKDLAKFEFNPVFVEPFENKGIAMLDLAKALPPTILVSVPLRDYPSETPSVGAIRLTGLEYVFPGRIDNALQIVRQLEIKILLHSECLTNWHFAQHETNKGFSLSENCLPRPFDSELGLSLSRNGGGSAVTLRDCSFSEKDHLLKSMFNSDPTSWSPLRLMLTGTIEQAVFSDCKFSGTKMNCNGSLCRWSFVGCEFSRTNLIFPRVGMIELQDCFRDRSTKQLFGNGVRLSTVPGQTINFVGDCAESKVSTEITSPFELDVDVAYIGYGLNPQPAELTIADVSKRSPIFLSVDGPATVFMHNIAINRLTSRKTYVGESAPQKQSFTGVNLTESRLEGGLIPSTHADITVSLSYVENENPTEDWLKQSCALQNALAYVFRLSDNPWAVARTVGLLRSAITEDNEAGVKQVLDAIESVVAPNLAAPGGKLPAPHAKSRKP